VPGLPDEGSAETICPAVPRFGHKRGVLLHPAGGPAERPEEACYHGLQDGSQVSFPLQVATTVLMVESFTFRDARSYLAW